MVPLGFTGHVIKIQIERTSPSSRLGLHRGVRVTHLVVQNGAGYAEDLVYNSPALECKQKEN